MTAEAHSGDLRNSQLFLDDRLIDDHVRVQRVWHQPQKYPKPVMEGKYPWEGDCPCLYGTVLRVDGTFRMWYVGTRNSSRPRVCYAESDDGLHWERPQLGICEFGGNKNNNIVIQPAYPDGFIDDCAMIYEPDDEWPYKLLYWDSLDVNPDHWGIFATRSKDGIHFESLGNVLHKWDDRFAAVTDKVDGKYRVYGRGTFETGVERAGLWTGRTDFVTEYALDPFPRKRPVSYTESEDLIHWTPGEQVIKTGTDDPWQMQYYSLTPFYYEGIWLAGLLRMHTIPDVLEEELVWSYDGRNWQRSIPRQPFIPRGPKGSFDSVWLNLPTNPPIVNYNQLWFYYSGRAGGHGAQFPEAYGAIGLATLRIDGFCSMYGGEQPGAMLTRPVTWPGGELMVNADPRRDISGHHSGDGGTYGSVRVELRDAENKPLDGYRFADCNPVTRNTRNFDEEPVWTAPERDNLAVKPLTWQEGRSARELAGKRIRLFFEVRDAHLYSFRAGSPSFRASSS